MVTKVSPGKSELDGACGEHYSLTKLHQILMGFRESFLGPVMILAKNVTNPLLTLDMQLVFKGEFWPSPRDKPVLQSEGG